MKTTVTVLFTDIVGSTGRYAALGERRAEQTAAEHLDLVTRAAHAASS